jgi:hypothetical protein
MFSIYMGYTLKCKYKCKLFTITYDLHIVYKKGYMKVGVEYLRKIQSQNI